MYIHKNNFDDFVRCQHSFLLGVSKKSLASKVISNAPTAKPHSSEKELVAFKHYVSDIAAKEMKKCEKLPLYDYRIGYTNKYSKKYLSKFLSSPTLIDDLNSLFSVFSSNIFLAYNMPVDIPIRGTSFFYRDIIDFVLADSEDDELINVVEIVDLSNEDLVKRMYSSWIHYKIPYSFLSTSFGKDVKVRLLDPSLMKHIDMEFKNANFTDYYSEISNLVTQIADKKHYFTKNLDFCPYCKYNAECIGDNNG